MKIKSSNGHVGTISKVDKDLALLPWGFSNGYFFRRQGRRNISLHRIILERIVGRKLTRNDFTDHIDRDTKNNKRSNIRLATNAQNQANQKLRKDNKSGYRNIHMYKGKWNVVIRVNGKKEYLGRYENIEEAKIFRDIKAKELLGIFASID